MTKKVIKPTTKKEDVNQFDALFERYQASEGSALVDKDVAAQVAGDRATEDARLAKVTKEEYKPKKYKGVRKVALEVIRTVFLDPNKWELRASVIGRMKSDPRIIFALSTLNGWTYAGLNTSKKTGDNTIRESVNYVLPGLMAETIIRGTGDPIMGKAPLEKRIPLFMSALQSDVIGVLKKAQRVADDKRTGEAPPERPPASVTPIKERKKQSRAKRKGRK